MSTDTLEVVLRRTTIRVQMADVDAAGILYFTTPYRWQEGLFTAWLGERGHPLHEMLAGPSGCPAVRSSCEYLRGIGLDEEVACELVVEHVGRTSFGVGLVGRTAGATAPAVRTATRHVWVERGADGRMASAPLPAWLRDALTDAA